MDNRFLIVLPASFRPVSFSRFFESNQELSSSPFLRSNSNRYLDNLELKIAIICLLKLLLAAALFWSGYKEPAQILLIFVYFFTGTPALIESIGDLINGNLQIDILMTVAAFASAATNHVFEGGLLLVLFALSRAIETAVTARARSSLSGLRQLAPKMALVKDQEGKFNQRHIEDVKIKDIILIKAGEIAPLDGKVVEGNSQIATAHLTGESKQIAKGPGDEITSGSQNGEGALQIEVERTSNDSTLFRLIELVTKAHAAKPRLQHIFERFESLYAKGIFFSAALLALMPPLLGFLSQSDALYRATCFLIAASPCALILAVPIAYLSSVSACAKRGIILKGGTALDALNRCKFIAFDKTGTLTADQMHVEQVLAWSRSAQTLTFVLEKEISASACSQIANVEANAQHPAAQALVHWGSARAGKIDEKISDFRAIAGLGVKARLASNDQELRIGQLNWAVEGLTPTEKQEICQRGTELGEQGGLICAAIAADYALVFSLSETVRPGAVEMIDQLKSKGMTVMMLTGDRKQNAQRIAQKLKIDRVCAELSPESKLKLIEEIDRTSSIAMIGDGINDAPALARATVGVALGGGGSALAAQAADIVLMDDKLELIVWLMAKAQTTQRVVTENLVLALGAILIASISSTFGWIPLAVAVCAHEGGTVIVGLNGLRLLKTAD